MQKGARTKTSGLLFLLVAAGAGVGAKGWSFLFLLLLLSAFIFGCCLCLFSCVLFLGTLGGHEGGKKGREHKQLSCFCFNVCWCWCWCKGLAGLIPSSGALWCFSLVLGFVCCSRVLFLGTLGRHEGQKGRDQKQLV